MAGARVKIDHTATLPDELLHKVFSYLPLRRKLSVESVSRRFQRCVLKVMKMQPQPLELYVRNQSSMNGYRIRSGLFDALRGLAKKAKFKSVRIHIYLKKPRPELTELMNALLSILSTAGCLDKVVSFECNYGPGQNILETILAQCVKLSTVRFVDFIVRPPHTQLLTSGGSFALDLNPALKTKALTQLHLELTGYSQQQLFELFGSLKPHTLQKLCLMFYDMPPFGPELDLAETVKQLRTNAWSSLKEIKICWETAAHIHLATFFESLALLPALNKCDIIMNHGYIFPDDQFVSAMPALLNSETKISLLSSEEGLLRCISNTDCQVVALIRELQTAHPNVSVYFYISPPDDFLYLTLTNNVGRFEEQAVPLSCGDDECAECHRFYPAVIWALKEIADECEDAHLEGYQLDRCRMDTVLEHLNYNCAQLEWTALTAEENVPGDLVTISCEAPGANYVHQYNITVDCGPCFDASCVACVNVD